LFSVAPGAGEISDGHELIVGVGPNGEKLTPGQRGATAVGAMIPFVPGGVARRVLGPVTDKIDDAIEFMGDAGKAAGKNADSVDGAGRVAGDAADTGGQAATKGGLGDEAVEAGSEGPKQAAKPTPNFRLPTNPPQVPPVVDSLPPDVRLFVGKPTQQYPHGYWKIEKFDGKGWQRLDPRTMKPGTHPDSHVPLPENHPGPFTN
jgi:hypothetical protein